MDGLFYTNAVPVLHEKCITVYSELVTPALRK